MPESPARPCRYTFDETVHEVVLREPGGDVPRVPETLVQDLWDAQRFDHAALHTTDDASIQVLDPGRLNADAGPDFRQARLRIDGVEWAGDVEIHLTSSGWQDHRHQQDARYNSVVLHVALHADMWTGQLRRADDSPLPELILYPHLQAPLRRLLHEFYTTARQHDILCASQWDQVPENVKEPWIRTLAFERLEQKKERLADRYADAPDLEELLHERLFAGLGYAKNAGAMATLARRLPLALVRQYEDATALEALHFGVAGLLPAPKDLLESDRPTADHAMTLRERFQQLNQPLERPVMERATWTFFRLRPANFPPLRIAQAVALLRPGGLLYEDPLAQLARALTNASPKTALRQCFDALPDPFWETHIRLVKTTKPRSRSMGKSRIDTLLVNAVAPVMLLHAEQQGKPTLTDAVHTLLRDLPAPRDRVTRRYQSLGTSASNALMAQGQHQLYRTRCTEARCLSCRIGQHLLDGRA